MRLQVTHITEYAYADNVSSGYGQMHLVPRDLPTQVCQSNSVAIAPQPERYRERLDFYGNRVGYFHIKTPHDRLAVTAVSVVDVSRPQLLAHLVGEPWEEVATRVGANADGSAGEARAFTLDSPLVMRSAELATYAKRSFPSGRPIGECLLDLQHRIRNEFEYSPGSTSVATPLHEVLTLRRGVCQDFAQLMIGCLRSLGLSARYVSGYLETEPPPGAQRLFGSDASHAWVSVFVPEAGWLDLDPTNNQLVDDRYVTTAWGRDYADVPPLEGVVFSSGTACTLVVRVDVLRVDEPATHVLSAPNAIGRNNIDTDDTLES